MPLLTLWVGLAAATEEIAIFQSDELPAYEAPARAFAEALGRPCHVYRIRGEKERGLSIAEHLRKDPPPLVFALGAKAAWVAAQELPNVPMVYAMVSDPARYGLAGPKITGVAINLPMDAVMAQVEVLLPDVGTIGVIVTPGQAETLLPAARTAAEKVGLEVKAEVVSDPKQLRRALSRLREDVQALWLVPDPELLTPANFRTIRDAAVRARLPLLTSSETLVRAGALLSVTPDADEVGAQAARLAAEILDAPPETPIPAPVTPERPRVVLNLDTLDALELALDPVQLDFVDETIEAAEAR